MTELLCQSTKLPWPWSHAREGGTALLAFLGMVGDQFVESGEEQRGLQWYALAWSLDPGGFESSLGLLSLFASASEDLDPTGEIRAIVMVRFQATRRTWSSRDLNNLHQLEALLQKAATRHDREALQAAPRR